ncbi:hypothetical protein [Rufibacter tibetensis]|nr:hypothetical protein [Rufibacter tibetensis]
MGKLLPFLFLIIIFSGNVSAQNTKYPPVAANDSSYFNAADKAEDEKDLPKAIYYHTKAISIAKPNSGEMKRSLVYRGVDKFFVGDVTGAIDDLEQALKMKVTNSSIYGMVDNNHIEGKFNALAWFILGDCYTTKDFNDAACFCYSKAGELGYEKAYKRISTYCNK